jgi:hypothetical protein
MRRIAGLTFALLGLVVPLESYAQTGAPADGAWPTYGGDLGSTKYSPLDQIDAANFGDLRLAWRWESVDGFLGMTTAGGGEWHAPADEIFDALNEADPDRWRDGNPPTISNLKATPLMVDGVLYLNTPTSAVVAIDAATGETIWVYNSKSYEEGTTTMSYTWNQRGVGYWSDGARTGGSSRARGTAISSASSRRRAAPARTSASTAGSTSRRGFPSPIVAQARLAEPADVLRPVSALRRGQHGDRSTVDLVVQHHQGDAARLDARVRRADRVQRCGPSTPFRGRVSSATIRGRTMPGSTPERSASGR